MHKPGTVLLASIALAWAGTVPAEQGRADLPDGALLNRELVTERFPEDCLRHPGIRHPDLHDHVRISRIVYASDGLAISGYLLEPKTGGDFSAIIFNRGGNRDYAALAFDVQLAQLADLAADGYVVVASQYRGAAGNPGRDQFGGEDVDDVLNLVPLLESLPNVDARRIGLFGVSRGGLMTYMALRRAPDIKAAVVIGGVSDLVIIARQEPDFGAMLRYLIGGSTETEFLERLIVRSAVYWPDEIPPDVALLMIHGTADLRVSPDQSVRLATALLGRSGPWRLELIEGGDHGLTGHGRRVRTLIGEWFARYLGPHESEPPLTQSH